MRFGCSRLYKVNAVIRNYGHDTGYSLHGVVLVTSGKAKIQLLGWPVCFMYVGSSSVRCAQSTFIRIFSVDLQHIARHGP